MSRKRLEGGNDESQNLKYSKDDGRGKVVEWGVEPFGTRERTKETTLFEYQQEATITRAPQTSPLRVAVSAMH